MAEQAGPAAWRSPTTASACRAPASTGARWVRPALGTPRSATPRTAASARAGRCTKGSCPPISGCPVSPRRPGTMVARDILLAELTGAHVHIAHISTARRGAAGARRQGARHPRHCRGHAAPSAAHRRGGARLRPEHEDGAAAAGKRDVEAVLEALADGTIDCVAIGPRAACAHREGGRVRGGRQRHRRAPRRRCRSSWTAWCAPAASTCRRWWRACPPVPRAC